MQTGGLRLRLERIEPRRVDAAASPLGLRPSPLKVKPASAGPARRASGQPRLGGGGPVPQSLLQPIQGDVAVAGLRPGVVHHHPQFRAVPLDQPAPGLRRHGPSRGQVDHRLHPCAGAVGVLPTRPAGRTESPSDLRGRHAPARKGEYSIHPPNLPLSPDSPPERRIGPVSERRSAGAVDFGQPFVVYFDGAQRPAGAHQPGGHIGVTGAGGHLNHDPPLGVVLHLPPALGQVQAGVP